jgi:hypothetical protein
MHQSLEYRVIPSVRWRRNTYGLPYQSMRNLLIAKLRLVLTVGLPIAMQQALEYKSVLAKVTALRGGPAVSCKELS